eukprot:5100287-Alexandrium_andersonii.AAC.1
MRPSQSYDESGWLTVAIENSSGRLGHRISICAPPRAARWNLFTTPATAEAHPRPFHSRPPQVRLATMP